MSPFVRRCYSVCLQHVFCMSPACHFVQGAAAAHVCGTSSFVSRHNAHTFRDTSLYTCAYTHCSTPLKHDGLAHEWTGLLTNGVVNSVFRVYISVSLIHMHIHPWKFHNHTSHIHVTSRVTPTSHTHATHPILSHTHVTSRVTPTSHQHATHPLSLFVS